jgi:hypothetical protein
MKDWKGKVSKMNSREWGNKTLYSFQLEGANMWLRTEEAPDYEVGDWVVAKGDTPNKIEEVEKIDEQLVKDEATAPVSATKRVKLGDAPPTNSADYWRWKQMYDLSRENAFLWRDARADAVRLIATCITHDQYQGESKDNILALGTKKSARLDVLRAMVEELSGQFVDTMEEKLNA